MHFPQEAPEIRLNDELLDNFVSDVVEDIALKTEDTDGVKSKNRLILSPPNLACPGACDFVLSFYTIGLTDSFFKETSPTSELIGFLFQIGYRSMMRGSQSISDLTNTTDTSRFMVNNPGPGQFSSGKDFHHFSKGVITAHCTC